MESCGLVLICFYLQFEPVHTKLCTSLNWYIIFLHFFCFVDCTSYHLSGPPFFVLVVDLLSFISNQLLKSGTRNSNSYLKHELDYCAFPLLFSIKHWSLGRLYYWNSYICASLLHKISGCTQWCKHIRWFAWSRIAVTICGRYWRCVFVSLSSVFFFWGLNNLKFVF